MLYPYVKIKNFPLSTFRDITWKRSRTDGQTARRTHGWTDSRTSWNLYLLGSRQITTRKCSVCQAPMTRKIRETLNFFSCTTASKSVLQICSNTVINAAILEPSIHPIHHPKNFRSQLRSKGVNIKSWRLRNEQNKKTQAKSTWYVAH